MVDLYIVFCMFTRPGIMVFLRFYPCFGAATPSKKIHPCTGEICFCISSTRQYMPHIYIHIHMRIIYIYIYIHTHRCILFMYVFCIFAVPAAQKSSAIFMYYAPFLLDMGVKMGYFSLNFRRLASAFQGFPRLFRHNQ